MDNVLSLLAATALCMLALMAYIAINKESKNPLLDSMAWGIGGLLSFSAEILLVWKLAW